MFVDSASFHEGEGWSAALPDLDSQNTVVFAFGAPDIARGALRDALRVLREKYPRSHLFGCSTAGEISGKTVRDDSLAVVVARFERTSVRSASASADAVGDSFRAGESVAKQLSAPDLRGVLVLSEGVGVNGSELIRGLNAVLPPEVVVSGGLAGDGARFERTWVLARGIPAERRVVALGLYGNSVRIGHGSQGGWDPFGPERRITRAVANVLYEIDGKPALALYKSYLGDQAEGLPASALHFPLAIRSSRDDEKMLVRTILSVDEAASSMTFAGDVPEGSLVRLMYANMERLIEGAAQAALTTAKTLTVGPSVSLAVSCIGRRLVLGERTEEEIEAALGVLPPSTALVGFYSYGEISPYATGACDLHNQTMTLTTISEAAE